MVAQILACRGLSAATVAIEPGRGSRRPAAASSTLGGDSDFPVEPRYRGRAITLTFDQFKYGWTNALNENEAKRPPSLRSHRAAIGHCTSRKAAARFARLTVAQRGHACGVQRRE
jgi:hypothetical protein